MQTPTNQYPWQQQPLQHFSAYCESGRLPHALLLSGVKGLGKHDFANNIAKQILCKNAGMSAAVCKTCYSCLLEDIAEHPDFYTLTPEAEGQAIKIDSVRELITQLQSTSYYHGYRVVQISPAENMNIAAANALLKTLEEPGENVLFILISNAIGRLPATLRSRCQTLRFQPNFSVETQQWLAQAASCSVEAAQALLLQAEGAPLQALQWAQDESSTQQQQTLLTDLIAIAEQQTSPLVIAQQWHEKGTIFFIDLFLMLLNQLLRMKVGSGLDKKFEIKSGFSAAHIPLHRWMDYTNEILQLRARCIKGANLNAQLLIESLLIKWSILFRC